VEGPKGACKGEKSGAGGGSLGERIRDGKGLAERRVKGRASPREPRRESCPRKGVAGERGCHGGSQPLEIRATRGRETRLPALQREALSVEPHWRRPRRARQRRRMGRRYSASTREGKRPKPSFEGLKQDT